MATTEITPPEGFVFDSPAPPAGFAVDNAVAAPPSGFEIDQSPTATPPTARASASEQPQATSETTADFLRRIPAAAAEASLHSAAGLARLSTDPGIGGLLVKGSLFGMLPDATKKATADFLAQAADSSAESFGVNQAADKSVGARVAGVLGGLWSAIPMIASGGTLGLAGFAGQMLGSAKESDYQGEIANGKTEEQAHEDSTKSAFIKTGVALPLFMAAGTAAGKLADSIGAAGPAQRAAVRFVANLVGNSVASSASRGVEAAVDGKPVLPAMGNITLEGLANDTAFALMGTAEGFKHDSAVINEAREVVDGTSQSDAYQKIIKAAQTTKDPAQLTNIADAMSMLVGSAHDVLQKYGQPDADPAQAERYRAIQQKHDDAVNLWGEAAKAEQTGLTESSAELQKQGDQLFQDALAELRTPAAQAMGLNPEASVHDMGTPYGDALSSIQPPAKGGEVNGQEKANAEEEKGRQQDVLNPPAESAPPSESPPEPQSAGTEPAPVEGVTFQGEGMGLMAFKDEQTNGNFSIKREDLPNDPAEQTKLIEQKRDEVRKAFAEPDATPEQIDQMLRDASPRTETQVAGLPITEAPVDQLRLSRDVPQFKGGANNEGVVAPLAGKFDRTGVGPIQVWRRTNGDLEVISGRHRLDLARRSGEATIPAQIHDESAGFDQRAAARLDAELNIRDEQGSTADYASYFRHSDLSEADAIARGLLARPKGKEGWTIARDASPDVFALHQSGRLSDNAAASIVEAAPGDQRLQAVGVRAINEGRSGEYAANLIKFTAGQIEARRAAGEKIDADADLFGNDDSALKEAEAGAQKVTQIQRDLREQINAVKGAARKPELAAKLGVNVKDPKGVQKRIKQLEAEIAQWDGEWFLQPELMKKLRGEEPAKVEQTAPKEEPKAPKLRAGEKQGDLLSTQSEPLKLVGEEAPDLEKAAREKAKAEADAAEAKAAAERDQMALFEPKPEPPSQPPAESSSAPAPTEAVAKPTLAKAKASDWKSRERFVGEDFAGPANSVVIQIRDLNSQPIGSGKPITLPLAENMEATAKMVHSGFSKAINDAGGSFRESVVTVLDKDGRAVAQMSWTPEGMRVAEQGALEAARTKFKEAGKAQEKAAAPKFETDLTYRVITPDTSGKGWRVTSLEKEDLTPVGHTEHPDLETAIAAASDGATPYEGKIEPVPGNNAKHGAIGSNPAPDALKQIRAATPSSDEVLNSSERVAVTAPDGATVLRVTPKKGNPVIESIKNVDSGGKVTGKKGVNVLKDVGPFSKIEAGTMGGKGGKEFIPIKGEVKIVPATEGERFMSATPERVGVTVEKGQRHFENVTRHIDQLKARVQGADITVLRNESELPTEVQAKLRPDTIHEGLTDTKTGKVWLFSDHISNVPRAAEVFAHEVTGHYGVERLIDQKTWKGIGDSILKNHPEEVADLARRYFSGEVPYDSTNQKHRDLLAKEFVARLAEQPSLAPTLWKRVVLAVQKALRALGIRREWSDAEIRDLIHQSANRVERPTKGGSDSGGIMASVKAPEPEKTTSTKNEVTDYERGVRGAPEIERQAAQSNTETFDRAKERLTVDPRAADKLVDALNNGTRKEVSEVDEALLLHEKVRLMNERDRAGDVIADKNASDEEKINARVEWAAAEARMNQVDQATYQSGRVWGRLGQFRQRLMRADYSFEAMQRKARVALDRPLNPDEVAKIKDQADKIAELEKRLADFENGKDKTDATGAADDKVSDLKKKAKSGKGKDVDPAALADKMRKRLRDGSTMDDLRAYVQKLALHFVRSGIKEREPLIDAVHRVLQTVDPTIERRRTMDLISGYGDYKALDPEAAKATLRDIKAQAQNVAKLQDIEAKQPLQKTGVQRQEPSDTTRRLIKLVNEAKKKFGVVTTDPASQLKSSLDAIKTRLKNQLKDLATQLETGEKPPEKTQVQYDAEIERLIALRDVVKRTLAEVEGKQEMSEADKIALAKRAVETQIAEYQRRLDESDTSPRHSPKKLSSPELDATRSRRDALREEYREMELLDADLQDAKNAARDKAQIEQTTKGIAELDRRISDGDLALRSKGQRPVSPELERLRAERTAMTQLLAKMRREAMPRRSPEERANQSLKTRMLHQQADLMDRIARKDFEKAPKPKPIALDPQNLAIKADLELTKKAFAEGVFEKKLADRSFGKKVLDSAAQTLNLTRAVLTSFDLSGVLRQGGFITLGNPLRAAKAFPGMFRAFASEHAAEQEMQALKARPQWQAYKDAKLEITENSADHLTHMEEQYMSRWVAKIPRALGGGFVRGSERSYRVFLNRLRADTFDSLTTALSRTGAPSDAEAKAIANFVNVATGRGALEGKYRNAAAAMNTVFFAPRYVLSRFQLLGLQPLLRGSARTRVAVATEYAKFLAGAAVVYGLAQLAQSDTDPAIELDPRSADFLKVRFGDTRLDPLAGLIQTTTLMGRLLSGQTKKTDGKIVPIRGDKVPYGSANSYDVIARFLRTKFAPLPGALVNVAVGKDLSGQPVTPLNTLRNMTVPISFDDAIKAFQAQGIAKASALSILSLFGFGLQTYAAGATPEEKLRAKITNRLQKRGIDVTPAQLAYEMQATEYRKSERAARKAAEAGR